MCKKIDFALGERKKNLKSFIIWIYSFKNYK